MEITELRIGNYISDEWANKKPFKVHFAHPVGRVKFGEKGKYSCKIDSIRGIELTEKWLKEFGFEFDGSYWKPKGCWHRYVFHKRAMFTNVLNLEPEGCIVPHAQVYYVHQLQNLYFALTGKELKREEKIKEKASTP